MTKLKLIVKNCPSKELAYTNLAYVHSSIYEKLYAESFTSAKSQDNSVRCILKNIIVNVSESKILQLNDIGLSLPLRLSANVVLDEEIYIQPWNLPKSEQLPIATYVECQLTLFDKSKRLTVNSLDLSNAIRTQYEGQVFTRNQMCAILYKVNNTLISFTIKMIEGLTFSEAKTDKKMDSGIINSATEFYLESAENSELVLTNSNRTDKNIFRSDFNFQQLGIGGLDKEFADIFRRAFAARIFPPSIMKELGIQYIKGLLLYGPPGTGKTLIARQIGQALRAREPKIVNGPEILNKFVGQSEENIRNLFKEAEEEYQKKKDDSSLHIIIFDEIDAICKQRGAAGAGSNVNDSIVNQLLSKIDGIHSLNNILFIGMTNRMDLIDDALLRPGRLEVHVEIGLPDTNGRLEILNIHTKKMRESKRLSPDVVLSALAENTKNFSGAELAGLVRSAASYAFIRQIDLKNLKAANVDEIVICQSDFDSAMSDIKPKFGVQNEILDSCLTNGVIDYSPEFKKILESLQAMCQQVRNSSKTPIMSALLWGKSGSGKTALAAYTAKTSNFPFIKIISPDHYIGHTEFSKVNLMKEVFENAYKSKISLIIIDNIERLVDFTPFGNRFSNAVLQTILVMIQKSPRKSGHRLFVLGTSSDSDFIQNSGIYDSFNVALKIPLLNTSKQIHNLLSIASKDRLNFPDSEIRKVCSHLKEPIGIKKLLLAYEMSSSNCAEFIDCNDFIDSLKSCGLYRN